VSLKRGPFGLWTLTLLTSGGRSIGIVRLLTEATEFKFRMENLSRVRFPTLSDFLRSSGYGTGPTQPR
jgi:hypothetical protein